MLTYQQSDRWIAEELLQKRMWVDTDDYGSLHACVQNDTVEVCKLLLDGGMDFDVYQQWAKNHPSPGHEDTIQTLSDYWSEIQAEMEQAEAPEMGGQALG